MPERIQLRRTAGWRKPDGAIVVARPSRWGNPFRVVRAPGGGPWEIRYGLTRDDHTWVGERDTKLDAQVAAVDMFAAALRDDCLLVLAGDVCRELAGHDLCCWCPLDEPCHADVLLRIANAQPSPPRPTPRSPRHDREHHAPRPDAAHARRDVRRPQRLHRGDGGGRAAAACRV